MIDYEHKTLNEYRLDANAEKIGLKIFKLSRHKKNACIYLAKTDDEKLYWQAGELQGDWINNNLRYSDDIFTHKNISLEELLKQYDFILILDTCYNQKQNDVKMKVLNTNVVKITYHLPGEKMTMHDIDISGGNFVKKLYNVHYSIKNRKINSQGTIVQETNVRFTLKKKYKYLENA